MVFFFVATQSGRHHTGSSQVTNNLLGIVAAYHRQASDIVMHHSRDRIMKDFICIRDD